MMIKKLLKERYYCGLDIGGHAVKACLIKCRDENHPGLLGVHETRTSGFVKSSVSSLGDMAQSIHETMTGLARKTGVKLKNVQLGIGGELIEKRIRDAVIPLSERGNKVITSRDVRKLRAQARLLGVHMDEIVICDFPQYYKIDDLNIAVHPQNLYGRKLEIHTLLLVANNILLKNVVKTVNHAGYDVSNVFFSSLAASTAILSDQDLEQGCLVVDIGSLCTNILCYKDRQLKDFERLPFGGDHLSQCIAKRLNLSEHLAEDIKRSYGFVVLTAQRNEEEILVKREEGYLPIRKAVLSEAMEPVIAEFEEGVSRVWNASNLTASSRGIVLSGGGAQLLGLPERLEMKARVPVKVGKVHIAVRRMHDSSVFASAVGLAQEGLGKSLGSSLSKSQGGKGLARWADKIKELYQEYF